MRLRIVATLLLTLFAGRALAQTADVSAERLQKDVEWLADDARQGRRPMSDGWRASGEYVESAFREAGLEAAGDDDGYFQRATDELGSKEGRNVVGILRAPGGAAKEHVVIMAHYDHLGVHPETGEVFNGADDNGSGTAALLEIVRTMTAEGFDRSATTRDIVFVATDMEEQGLAGARYYVDHPSLPIEDTAAMVCVDMLGRSVLDQMNGHVVAIGAERSRAIRESVDRSTRATGDLVWHLATEYVGPRSDFVPFSARRVPYVWYTTATHRDYHKTTDDAALVDYASLAVHTALVRATLVDLASVAERPAWTGNEPDRLAEARTVSEMSGILLDRLDVLQGEGKNHLIAPQILLVRGVHALSNRLLAKGEVSDVERAALIAASYVLVLGVVDDTPYETMKTRLERIFGK